MLFTSAFSQTYPALKIGDHVPDVTIRNFFDDDKKTMPIKELYRNKLLILDFWGTWCGACLDEIATFPQLKAQFGDKLNILTVGYESKEKIAALFNRNPSLHSTHWATLYNDSLLTYKLFPHHLLPHLVWIDSTGRITAITEGYELNAINVKNMLNGRPIAAKVKTDENSDLDVIDRPFRQMDTNFVARSILTRRMPGGLSFYSMHPYANDIKAFRNRTFEGNLTMSQLYFYAIFFDGNPLNEDRLIFEIKDSLKFTHPKKAPQSFKKSLYKSYDEWADSNLYCYELVLPKMSPDSVLRRTMLFDLNHYFNLNGRWEQRIKQCYVIHSKTKSLSPSISPVADKVQFYSLDKREALNLGSLVELLNKRLNKGYVIDESGLPPDKIVTVNTSFKGNIGPQGIAEIFKNEGLRITVEDRKIPVYIVSEF